MAERLDIVSAERIRDELSKLLVAEDPTPGLELVVDTGLADRFLPELSALRLEQDPVHQHKDVLRHTFAVVARCRPPDDLRLRLAALLHDVGKPATRQFTPEGVQFHHHEIVGARMAEERLRALRFPNDVIRDVAKLIETQGGYDRARDDGHMSRDLANRHFKDLLLMAELGTPGPPACV